MLNRCTRLRFYVFPAKNCEDVFQSSSYIFECTEYYRKHIIHIYCISEKSKKFQIFDRLFPVEKFRIITKLSVMYTKDAAVSVSNFLCQFLGKSCTLSIYPKTRLFKIEQRVFQAETSKKRSSEPLRK